ncbi:hybrid sensor histidine kinase/response regulator [Gloeothece verrucosa]|uniref:histidine kinase n=1 Tax=Gloeothece verrucosa (strain PCC 7822) TaxID=497965 RepID=E0ULT7_GLOV7|nr:hybrid sensor histidine kinase/response regulator [Gloeothece verrucosa]ADN17917.1 response regulator receiver sensor signal transduction histidine kinase [Gloeothece verrucosa PCC 7822]
MPKIEFDILIIDDEVENLRLLALILGEAGYQVRSAINGRAALGVIKNQIPDLILLDVKMPVMDGFELCQTLKAASDWCDIPIVFLSAAEGVSDKVKAFELGGVDYITKPYHAAEVIARVHIHLSLHQLKEELSKRNEFLRRQNDGLAAQIKATQEAQNAMRFVLHTVSHDLKNPLLGWGLTLSTILGQQKGEICQIERRVLSTMLSSCSSQERLIDSLVGAQREKEGVDGLVLNLTTVQLEEIVSEVLLEWRLVLEKNAVTVNHELFIESCPVLKADVVQLRRVYFNLIGNALKYNEPGIILTLKALLVMREEREWLQCWVIDNGVGIPRMFKKNLFKPYSSSGQGVKSAGFGHSFGLGLYICQKIIEAHGGIIGLEETEKGAAFWFDLPLSNYP